METIRIIKNKYNPMLDIEGILFTMFDPRLNVSQQVVAEVEKYLDDCLLKNFKVVRIIHGMGTGALRDAVRDYLDTCSFVESYRYGESFEGSTGATVVTLK